MEEKNLDLKSVLGMYDLSFKCECCGNDIVHLSGIEEEKVHNGDTTLIRGDYYCEECNFSDEVRLSFSEHTNLARIYGKKTSLKEGRLLHPMEDMIYILMSVITIILLSSARKVLIPFIAFITRGGKSAFK